MRQMRLIPILCLVTNIFCTPKTNQKDDILKDTRVGDEKTKLEVLKDSLYFSTQDSNTTIIKLTKSKWYLSRVSHGEDVRNLGSLEENNNWVDFKLNGVMEVMEFGENYMGTWELVKEDSILITDDIDGRVERNIIKLQDSILITSNFLGGKKLITYFDKSPNTDNGF